MVASDCSVVWWTLPSWDLSEWSETEDNNE